MAYGVEIEADDIRGVKTDFLRELIKNTSWSERGRISGLTDLEHKLVCGVQHRWASHVSYGNLLVSYPTEYKAMVEELVQCDWLSAQRKYDIQAEFVWSRFWSCVYVFSSLILVFVFGTDF